LGHPQLQAGLSKREAIDLIGRIPDLTRPKVRPFSDAAARFTHGGADLSR
jgi:hypothetical protein